MQVKNLRFFLALFLFIGLLTTPANLQGQCTFFPASAGSSPPVTFSFSGGFFASFGCAPIDPTYWVAGNGPSCTLNFSTPQASPIIRVWGMNTDDVASVAVNGLAYPLNASSATELPKVVCGLSPGPLGVVFSAGNFAGGNTPAQGNYSYSDIVLNTSNVSSIRIDALSGAGWGIAGVSINCVLDLDAPSASSAEQSKPQQQDFAFWPNPVKNELNIRFDEAFQPRILRIYDALGKEVAQFTGLLQTQKMDVSFLAEGVYSFQCKGFEGKSRTGKFIKK